MKGIVQFAHIICCIVVAEGVEDDNMERMVNEMEADLGQGYKYAKPMSEEAIEALLDMEDNG